MAEMKRLRSLHGAREGLGPEPEELLLRALRLLPTGQVASPVPGASSEVVAGPHATYALQHVALSATTAPVLVAAGCSKRLFLEAVRVWLPGALPCAREATAEPRVDPGWFSVHDGRGNTPLFEAARWACLPVFAYLFGDLVRRAPGGDWEAAETGFAAGFGVDRLLFQACSLDVLGQVDERCKAQLQGGLPLGHQGGKCGLSVRRHGPPGPHAGHGRGEGRLRVGAGGCAGAPGGCCPPRGRWALERVEAYHGATHRRGP